MINDHDYCSKVGEVITFIQIVIKFSELPFLEQVTKQMISEDGRLQVIEKRQN